MRTKNKRRIYNGEIGHAPFSQGCRHMARLRIGRTSVCTQGNSSLWSWKIIIHQRKQTAAPRTVVHVGPRNNKTAEFYAVNMFE